MAEGLTASVSIPERTPPLAPVVSPPLRMDLRPNLGVSSDGSFAPLSVTKIEGNVAYFRNNDGYLASQCVPSEAASAFQILGLNGQSRMKDTRSYDVANPGLKSAYQQAEELFNLIDKFSAQDSLFIVRAFEKELERYQGVFGKEDRYLERFHERLASLIKDKHLAIAENGISSRYQFLSSWSSTDVISWYLGVKQGSSLPFRDDRYRVIQSIVGNYVCFRSGLNPDSVIQTKSVVDGLFQLVKTDYDCLANCGIWLTPVEGDSIPPEMIDKLLSAAEERKQSVKPLNEMLLVPPNEQARHLFMHLNRFAGGESSDRYLIIKRFSDLIKEHPANKWDLYRSEVFTELAKLIVNSKSAGESRCPVDGFTATEADAIIADYVRMPNGKPAEGRFPRLDSKVEDEISSKLVVPSKVHGTGEIEVLGVLPDPSFAQSRGQERGALAYVLYEKNKNGKELLWLFPVGFLSTDVFDEPLNSLDVFAKVAKMFPKEQWAVVFSNEDWSHQLALYAAGPTGFQESSDLARCAEMAKTNPDLFCAISHECGLERDTLKAFDTSSQLRDPIGIVQRGDPEKVKELTAYFDYDVHRFVQYLEQKGYYQISDIAQRRALVEAAFFAHISFLNGDTGVDVGYFLGQNWREEVPLARSPYDVRSNQQGFVEYPALFFERFVSSLLRLYPQVSVDLKTVLPVDYRGLMVRESVGESLHQETLALVDHLREVPNEDLLFELQRFVIEGRRSNISLDQFKDHPAVRRYPPESQQAGYVAVCLAKEANQQYLDGLFDQLLVKLKELDPCLFERVIDQSIKKAINALDKYHQQLLASQPNTPPEQFSIMLKAVESSRRILLEVSGGNTLPLQGLSLPPHGVAASAHSEMKPLAAILKPLLDINREVNPRLFLALTSAFYPSEREYSSKLAQAGIFQESIAEDEVAELRLPLLELSSLLQKFPQAEQLSEGERKMLGERIMGLEELGRKEKQLLVNYQQEIKQYRAELREYQSLLELLNNSPPENFPQLYAQQTREELLNELEKGRERVAHRLKLVEVKSKDLQAQLRSDLEASIKLIALSLVDTTRESDKTPENDMESVRRLNNQMYNMVKFISEVDMICGGVRELRNSLALQLRALINSPVDFTAVADHLELGPKGLRHDEDPIIEFPELKDPIAAYTVGQYLSTVPDHRYSKESIDTPQWVAQETSFLKAATPEQLEALRKEIQLKSVQLQDPNLGTDERLKAEESIVRAQRLDVLLVLSALEEQKPDNEIMKIQFFGNLSEFDKNYLINVVRARKEVGKDDFGGPVSLGAREQYLAAAPDSSRRALRLYFEHQDIELYFREHAKRFDAYLRSQRQGGLAELSVKIAFENYLAEIVNPYSLGDLTVYSRDYQMDKGSLELRSSSFRSWFAKEFARWLLVPQSKDPDLVARCHYYGLELLRECPHYLEYYFCSAKPQGTSGSEIQGSVLFNEFLLGRRVLNPHEETVYGQHLYDLFEINLNKDGGKNRNEPLKVFETLCSNTSYLYSDLYEHSDLVTNEQLCNGNSLEELDLIYRFSQLREPFEARSLIVSDWLKQCELEGIVAHQLLSEIKQRDPNSWSFIIGQAGEHYREVRERFVDLQRNIDVVMNIAAEKSAQTAENAERIIKICADINSSYRSIIEDLNLVAPHFLMDNDFALKRIAENVQVVEQRQKVELMLAAIQRVFIGCSNIERYRQELISRENIYGIVDGTMPDLAQGVE